MAPGHLISVLSWPQGFCIPYQAFLNLLSTSCSLLFIGTRDIMSQDMVWMSAALGQCISWFCTRSTAPYHSVENWELCFCTLDTYSGGIVLQGTAGVLLDREISPSSPARRRANICCLYLLKNSRLAFLASLPPWDHWSLLVYVTCMSFVKHWNKLWHSDWEAAVAGVSAPKTCPPQSLWGTTSLL